MFWLRFSGLVIGYLVMLFGALSLLSVPLHVSFLCMIAGAIFLVISFQDAPAMTRRSWLVMIIGMAVVFGVLSLFGDARVRQWRPHPAGYIPAWIGLFHAFRHIRHVFTRYL
jgi:hypothetical protein